MNEIEHLDIKFVPMSHICWPENKLLIWILAFSPYVLIIQIKNILYVMQKSNFHINIYKYQQGSVGTAKQLQTIHPVEYSNR